ncbi:MULTISPECIES: TolC family protein [Roseobacteraceae]|uniref:Outer membrane channel protein TolC n=1 Tax=Pseudosulfitobacter pseudonitzschiae TaxID=1402135 RepID=A0A221K7U6_9RHOB|nr:MULTISPECIES: TolC family protein [Roseobacteraceae]ASM74943.1 outer membrane channel protein TolC [Pseudosulfitobacter pseudonitzschiae]
MIALPRPGLTEQSSRIGGKIAPLAALMLALVLALPAAAQISLQSAVLQATERDGNIGALRQTVASRSIDIQAARDGYYPSISISGDSSTTDSNGPGITLTVSQVLYDWGLIRSKINAASQVRVQAVSDLKMAVEGLSLQVAEFFIDIETIDLKISRTRAYTTFARRIAGQAQDRSSAGISDNGEVARARLEIARAEDQLAQLIANRSIALSQIEFLVGRQVGGVQSPPELGFASRYAQPEKIRSSVRIAPTYIAARAAADEAAAGVETAKASRLPTIKLQAQGRADLNGGRSRTAVGISTGVDLSSSGLGRRNVQSAELNLQAAKSTLGSVERDLINTASSARQQITILRTTERSRNQQLTEAQRVLDNYEQQFIGGQRELLDLLTTGRDLYDSQIDKIDTYDERKRTEYRAAHDLGVLGTLIISASTTQ